MTPRRLGALLALLAIVLMLVASFSRNWWVAQKRRETIRSGFLGVEICSRSQCTSASWSTASDRERVFRLVTYAGYGALVGTLLLAGILGFAAFRAMLPDAAPPKSSGLVAAVVACVGLLGAIAYAFVWEVIEIRQHFSVGWAAYVYFVGAVGAIAAGILCRIDDAAAASDLSG